MFQNSHVPNIYPIRLHSLARISKTNVLIIVSISNSPKNGLNDLPYPSVSATAFTIVRANEISYGNFSMWQVLPRVPVLTILAFGLL